MWFKSHLTLSHNLSIKKGFKIKIKTKIQNLICYWNGLNWLFNSIQFICLKDTNWNRIFWMYDFFFSWDNSIVKGGFEILKYVSVDNNKINWVTRLLTKNVWIKYAIFRTSVKSINKAYWLNVEESYNCKKIVETDLPIWILHSILLTSKNFQIADAYLFFLRLKI